jgi:hypothetical protein
MFGIAIVSIALGTLPLVKGALLDFRIDISVSCSRCPSYNAQILAEITLQYIGRHTTLQ